MLVLADWATRHLQALAALQRKAPNASLVAVYKKYCSSKFNEVSAFAQMQDSPGTASS